MVTSSIKINGGVAGVSVDDLVISTPATLSNDDDTGVTSWLWEFVNIPEGSVATLSTPTSSTSGFTPDVDGSYLVELTVNGRIKSRLVGAVKTAIGQRFPARHEENELGGWHKAYKENMELLETTIGVGGVPSHAIGGAQHTASTLGEVNLRISGGDLDFSTAPRPPGGTAGGQLGGTYPNPDIRGIRETLIPTLLTFGAISDGQLLAREAATVIGYYPETPLPELEWIGVSTVNVKIRYKDIAHTFDFESVPTVRLTLQDHKQRSFTGTLTFDPSTTGDGGLDTGTETADAWYYLYLVPKISDDNLLTVRGSLQAPVDEPTSGPTGLPNFRYIGAVRNASSNLVEFVHSAPRKFIYPIQALLSDTSYTGKSTTALIDPGASIIVDPEAPLTADHIDLNVFVQRDSDAGSGRLLVEMFVNSKLDATSGGSDSANAYARYRTNIEDFSAVEDHLHMPLPGTGGFGLRIYTDSGSTKPSTFEVSASGYDDGYL